MAGRWTTMVVLASMLSASCGSNDKARDTSDTAPEADAWECDPNGDDAVMSGLLNEPLADDVEVIWKDPQHPGLPGPDDLP